MCALVFVISDAEKAEKIFEIKMIVVGYEKNSLFSKFYTFFFSMKVFMQKTQLFFYTSGIFPLASTDFMVLKRFGSVSMLLSTHFIAHRSKSAELD